MKISGKNNQFDNQPINNKPTHKSDVNYEERDIANSPNPAEYLGRSQIIFTGRGDKSKKNNPETNRFKPVKLTETPSLSKEEAIEFIKKFNFTDGDLAALDIDNEETISRISNMKAYIETGIVKEEDIENFKEEMKDSSIEKKKEAIDSFSDSCKYANKENLETFKEYIKIEDSDDLYNFISFIQNAEDTESFFEKLPLIKSVQGKLEIRDLRSVFKFYNKADYDNITPESVNILNTINSHLPDDLKFNVAFCRDIGEQEKDLTPELLEKYCNLIDELSNQDMMDITTLRYNYAGDTVLSHADKMEKVSKWLKDYPLDLKSSDDKKISLDSFYKLSKNDGNEAKTYINSLTADAKYQGILKFLDENNTLPKDKLSELCNILYDKAYGKIYDEKVFNYVDENKGENCEYLDGIIDLIKVYKGTDELKSYYPEHKLCVGNRDYKGAVEALKLKLDMDKAGIPFNESAFYHVMYDKDADFKKFNEILTYMKDNSLSYHDYPYPKFSGEKGLNKLELRHFIKEKKFWLNDEQYEELDNLAVSLETDDEKAFVKEHLFQEDDNNNIIFYTNDVKELLTEYRKNPEIITDILNERNDDGEVKYRRVKDSIIPISEAMAIDKDYTKFIMKLKRHSGRSRFDYKSLKNVVEAHQINPAFTNRLLAEVATLDDYGNPHYEVDEKILEKLNNNELPEITKEEHTNFRHSSDDIRELIDIHSIDPEFTEFLLDKYTDVRTDTNEIRTIVNSAQKDKKLVKTLLTESLTDWRGNKYNRFSPYTIDKILNNLPSDTQFVYDIVSAQKENYYEKGKMEPLYSNDDIVNLCSAAHIDLELTKDLMKEKLKSYRDEEYNRFDSSEIKDLVDCAQKDRAIFDDILKQTKLRYKGIEPRYDASDIRYIMRAAEIDKDCALGLLKVNESYQDCNAYASHEMTQIAEAHKQDPAYVDTLIAKKKKNYKGELFPLLNGEDITNLLEAHGKDPDYTDALVEEYEKANGKDYCAFDGKNIKELVESHLKDKELTEELAAQSVIGENNERVKRFEGQHILSLVSQAQDDKEYFRYIINNKTVQNNGRIKYTFTPGEIDDLISVLSDKGNVDPERKEYLKTLIDNKGLRNDINTTKLPVRDIVKIIKTTTFEQYKTLEAKVGDKIKDYNANDILTALEFEDLYQRKSINEIPIKLKKGLLRRLVAANTDLFETSDAMRQDFPLIPNNQDEYCAVLPALVRSLGIETNTLTEEQVEKFNKTITDLSGNLAKLSDEEYNKLTISQEYDKDSFTKDVLEKIKDLEPAECQKVYDYFGFELHENPNNKATGFSIVGYPVNLNNGKKLAEITDENTKKVVEKLRPDVIKFSEQNKINCSDKTIEKELNEIVNVLPEIRTMIGKKQNKSHEFDLFKHSLKVMQKITQDENFEKLNESDKKIMLLATLMHDITKVEGVSDETHPEESSYDTFFISKKFNLTKDEEIKLYTLIRQHEWLAYVNTAKTEDQRKKAQQSVAFDLQQNNLFDLALMFTHADLKSVKKSDLFHDKTEGNSRIDFNGEIRSFGDAADFHAEKIKEYIGELKKSQPLMPTTKMPKASDIEKLVTNVNPDGSTNIKGVYIKKDEEGKNLVIVKFNEVEDESWEAMGLPKGSSTKGVIAHCNDGEKEYDVETGNIKFFVHGLDYPNQLAKFDAFSLLNSDALLSVSYAERPETKFRFFRAQGVMLEDSADYVYGGGNTDSGSGCGKNIDEFKNNYVFGGYREHDRKYISNLVKEATGMNDDEYVKFVEKFKNQPMTAIEPKDTREKIIKAFATINSNKRKGNREYNEMYLSNPKSVMGVYAYEMYQNQNIPDPLKFLEDNDNRTKFLQDYAIEHDIPFFVFGD